MAEEDIIQLSRGPTLRQLERSGDAGTLVTVTYNEQTLDLLQQVFRQFPRKLRSLLPKAINRTLEHARAVTTDQIAAIKNIMQKRIRERLVITRATGNRWEGNLAISSRRIPLMAFSAKWRVFGSAGQKDLDSGRATHARAVTYNIDSQKVAPHAFITELRSGHKGVFQRKGKARYPIRELFGPSLGRVVKDAPAILSRVTSQSEDDLNKNIVSYVRLALAGKI